MIIAVDFDGTLHQGQWPEIGTIMPDARKMMQKLKAEGHYIIIWTCREHTRQTEMVNWLIENDIPFDRVNDHKANTWQDYGYEARKVYAHVYVDDKQVGGLPPWADIYSYIVDQEAEYMLKQANK